MGILKRFTDIMKANINDLLDRCEDPAKMIDQTLRELNESLAEVKKETASVMAEEKRCARLKDSAEAEVRKWDDLARKALTAGNEDHAREFLAKKQQAQGNLDSALTTYNAAAENASKMRQMHDKLVSDINILNGKRDSIKATVAVAKTQKKVNEATASVNMDGAMSKFARMEQKANQMLDSATAMAELNSEPVDPTAALAAQYTSGAGSASVDDELAKLKAEMGMGV